MSQSNRNEYTLGLCVLAALIAVLTFTVLSNRSSTEMATDQTLLLARFSQVDGVARGTEVRFAGMPIGQVERLALKEDFRVDVTLAVDPTIEIPTDSAALIETDGLFGAKYIEIQPGGEFDTVSSGDGRTFTQDSVIWEELVSKIIDQAKEQRGLE